MSIKRNNRLFLFFAILFTFSQLVLSTYKPLNQWGLTSLIPYFACVLIGVLFLKKDGETFFGVLPFKVGLKPNSALLIAAMTFLLMPLNCALAELGANIGGNMTGMFEQSVSSGNTPFVELFFTTAMIPALFEELFFRGFFYAGFKKARGIRFSILMTSILFGFFHMNVQQVIYASVLGIVIAIFRELTGSMWGGILFHFINNGWSCLQIVAPDDSFFCKLPLEQVSFARHPVYSTVMMIVCTAAAIWLLFRLAKAEGKTAELKTFFKEENPPREKVVTPAFIFGWIIYIGITALIFFMLPLIQNGTLTIPAAG